MTHRLVDEEKGGDCHGSRWYYEGATRTPADGQCQ